MKLWTRFKEWLAGGQLSSQEDMERWVHFCDPKTWTIQPGRNCNSTGAVRYGCPVCGAGEYREQTTSWFKK